MLPLTTAVIGFLLGLGGLREFLVDGIWYGRLQPLLVGAAGALVASLRRRHVVELRLVER